MTKKELPLIVPFLFAGLNVTLLSYLETYISPQLSSVIYSLPIDLLIITSFMIFSASSKKKIVRMIATSGVIGQIGAILFLISFIYLSKNDEISISVAVVISLIIWTIYNYLFIYL